MLGLAFTGRVVQIELPDNDDGFANIKLEGERWDGEPFWFRAAFPIRRQNGEPTRAFNEISALDLGEIVAVAVEPRITRAGGSIWFKATGCERVAQPAPA